MRHLPASYSTTILGSMKIYACVPQYTAIPVVDYPNFANRIFILRVLEGLQEEENNCGFYSRYNVTDNKILVQNITSTRNNTCKLPSFWWQTLC